MAFAKGNQSTEGAARKFYIGYANCLVLGINPTKAEIEKLRGFTPTNDPIYVSDNNGVRTVRIEFLVKPCKSLEGKEYYMDSNNNPIDTVIPVTMFLRKEYRKGSQTGKIEVIDKYGRTAWATEDDIKNHRIPMYTNGPARIDIQYRPSYVGERDLINFLKAYLNIDNCEDYKDGKWCMKPATELPSCEAYLDRIDNLFNGDVSELKDIIGYQPNNRAKIAFGIRTNDNNQMYQAAYTGNFLRCGSTNVISLIRSITDEKAQGRLSNIEFDFNELHEYTVNPTKFTSNENGAEVVSTNPFESNNESEFPF